MKFTFEDLLQKKDWLTSNIINSLRAEDYTEQVTQDKYFDVMLSINGNLVEPVLLNEIIGNIASVIEAEAKSMIKEELEDAQEKVRKLTRLLDSFTEHITDKIESEYDLKTPEYD